MKIIIFKESDNTYCADPVWKPGTPIVGRGKTRLKALINLLYSLDFEVEIKKENLKICNKD